MRAMDVMTTEVVTVDPDTSVQRLAALLSERGISGEPVVDGDNRVVGIVSEGDLLHRAETGTEQRPKQRTGRRRSWWLDTIASDRELARGYVKSHGRAVKEVMTVPCRLGQRYDRARRHRNSARDKADQARAGRLRRQARRHPQPGEPGAGSDEDKSAPAAIFDPGDRAIGDQLLAELQGRKWVDISSADIIVRNRVVHLWFSDKQPREERLTFRVAAEYIPGVRRVEEHIVAPPTSGVAPGGGGRQP
jgi:hypothetical protein